jgi:hypothetical protein
MSTEPTAIEKLLARIGGAELHHWHRVNGADVSATSYLIQYRRVLLNGLANSIRIYLDTNYWIYLRDAAMGRAVDGAGDLLEELRSLVRSRRAICVLHFSTFGELAQQQGESLKATARLVDELTEGIAIVTLQELRYWQAGEYVAEKLGLAHEASLGAWTKVGQIFHSNIPLNKTNLSVEGRRAILKGALDSFWNATMEDLCAQFDWETRNKLNVTIDAQTIAAVEARKAQQLSVGLSRQRIRADEFKTHLRDHFESLFAEQLRKANHQLGGVWQDKEIDRIAKGLVVTCFREFRSDRLGALLPSAAIPCELYSLYENDAKRRLRATDWNDWEHASAALPYCHYFFTERHLAHQLTNVLGADRRYGCAVAGNIQDARDMLRNATGNLS